MFRIYAQGFTLAEILISLAILGEIAAFTIPKVLNAQQNGQYNAIAKEAAAMFSAAFQQAQLAGTVSASMSAKDLTQYMHYVSVDSSTPIDNWQTGTTYGCNITVPCLVLHNGARMAFHTSAPFAGTSPNDSIFILVDPNGRYSGTTNGPDKSIGFVIFYNGRLSTMGEVYGTVYDPPWFHW